MFYLIVKRELAIASEQTLSREHTPAAATNVDGEPKAIVFRPRVPAKATEAVLVTVASRTTKSDPASEENTALQRMTTLEAVRSQCRREIESFATSNGL